MIHYLRGNYPLTAPDQDTPEFARLRAIAEREQAMREAGEPDEQEVSTDDMSRIKRCIVLEYISSHPGCNIASIGELEGVSKPVFSGIVSRMVRAGFVNSVVSNETRGQRGRRPPLLYVSQTGESYLRDGCPPQGSHHRRSEIDAINLRLGFLAWLNDGQWHQGSELPIDGSSAARRDGLCERKQVQLDSGANTFMFRLTDSGRRFLAQHDRG